MSSISSVSLRQINDERLISAKRGAGGSGSSSPPTLSVLGCSNRRRNQEQQEEDIPLSPSPHPPRRPRTASSGLAPVREGCRLEEEEDQTFSQRRKSGRNDLSERDESALKLGRLLMSSLLEAPEVSSTDSLSRFFMDAWLARSSSSVAEADASSILRLAQLQKDVNKIHANALCGELEPELLEPRSVSSMEAKTKKEVAAVSLAMLDQVIAEFGRAHPVLNDVRENLLPMMFVDPPLNTDYLQCSTWCEDNDHLSQNLHVSKKEAANLSRQHERDEVAISNLVAKIRQLESASAELKVELEAARRESAVQLLARNQHSVQQADAELGAKQIKMLEKQLQERAVEFSILVTDKEAKICQLQGVILEMERSKLPDIREDLRISLEQCSLLQKEVDSMDSALRSLKTSFEWQVSALNDQVNAMCVLQNEIAVERKDMIRQKDAFAEEKKAAQDGHERVMLDQLQAFLIERTNLTNDIAQLVETKKNLQEESMQMQEQLSSTQNSLQALKATTDEAFAETKEALTTLAKKEAELYKVCQQVSVTELELDSTRNDLALLLERHGFEQHDTLPLELLALARHTLNHTQMTLRISLEDNAGMNATCNALDLNLKDAKQKLNILSAQIIAQSKDMEDFQSQAQAREESLQAVSAEMQSLRVLSDEQGRELYSLEQQLQAATQERKEASAATECQERLHSWVCQQVLAGFSTTTEASPVTTESLHKLFLSEPLEQNQWTSWLKSEESLRGACDFLVECHRRISYCRPKKNALVDATTNTVLFAEVPSDESEAETLPSTENNVEEEEVLRTMILEEVDKIESISKELKKERMGKDEAQREVALLKEQVLELRVLLDAAKQLAPISSAAERLAPISSAAEQLPPISSAAERLAPISSAAERLAPISSAAKQLAPISSAAERLAPISSAAEQLPPISSATEQLAPISSAAKLLAPVPSAAERLAPVPSAAERLAPVPSAAERLAPVPSLSLMDGTKIAVENDDGFTILAAKSSGSVKRLVAPFLKVIRRNEAMLARECSQLAIALSEAKGLCERLDHGMETIQQEELFYYRTNTPGVTYSDDPTNRRCLEKVWASIRNLRGDMAANFTWLFDLTSYIKVQGQDTKNRAGAFAEMRMSQEWDRVANDLRGDMLVAMDDLASSLRDRANIEGGWKTIFKKSDGSMDLDMPLALYNDTDRVEILSAKINYLREKYETEVLALKAVIEASKSRQRMVDQECDALKSEMEMLRREYGGGGLDHDFAIYSRVKRGILDGSLQLNEKILNPGDFAELEMAAIRCVNTLRALCAPDDNDNRYANVFTRGASQQKLDEVAVAEFYSADVGISSNGSVVASPRTRPLQTRPVQLTKGLQGQIASDLKDWRAVERQGRQKKAADMCQARLKQVNVGGAADIRKRQRVFGQDASPPLQLCVHAHTKSVQERAEATEEIIFEPWSSSRTDYIVARLKEACRLIQNRVLFSLGSENSIDNANESTCLTSRIASLANMKSSTDAATFARTVNSRINRHLQSAKQLEELLAKTPSLSQAEVNNLKNSYSQQPRNLAPVPPYSSIHSSLSTTTLEPTNSPLLVAPFPVHSLDTPIVGFSDSIASSHDGGGEDG